MTMPYMNTWLSITAYINQQMSMIVANGLCRTDEIEMFDWEAHANVQELPAVHLIGPASLSLEERSAQIYDVSFVVGVGSWKDEGLFNHRKMVDIIFKALASGTKFSVYDNATEQPYSWLKITDGTTVAPMTKTGERAFQFIQAEGKLDPFA